MNKMKPDLCNHLATIILKNKYCKDNISSRELNNFTEQMEALVENSNYKKSYMPLYLKIQRMFINRILVDIYLLELPEEKRKFLYYFYGQQQNYGWISDKLAICPTKIFIMHREIVRDIYNLYFFRLSSADDIFHRLRIINMLHIIDMRLQSFDMAGEFVNSLVLDRLKKLRCAYRKLLDQINTTVVSSSIEGECIKEKITNSDSSLKSIADKIFYSKSSVCRVINNYQKNMKEFLLEVM